MRSGVILDSGDVLIRPVSGRWYPPPAFEDVLGIRQAEWPIERLPAALEAAGQWLNEVHVVPLADEADERLVWVRYYAFVLELLGFAADRHELAETITAAWETTLWVEPFPWTLPVLRELSTRSIPVVVLSDAWPSLRRWFRELGLDAYVDAMVISGEEGITKPDRRVFDKARALLDANDIVFVDDDPDNVRGAIAQGMRGLRLRHPDKTPDPTLTEISDLNEVLAQV